MRQVHLALVLSASFLLTGCAPHLNLNAPFESRPPNRYESFFVDVASDFGAPEVCEKISSRAVRESWSLGSGEWDVHTTRSECYFYAAIKTKDAALCSRVRRSITLPSNEGPFSASACRQFIQENQRPAYTPFPEVYLMGALMRELGFREGRYLRG